jgi:hypothetical protein
MSIRSVLALLALMLTATVTGVPGRMEVGCTVTVVVNVSAAAMPVQPAACVKEATASVAPITRARSLIA